MAVPVEKGGPSIAALDARWAEVRDHAQSEHTGEDDEAVADDRALPSQDGDQPEATRQLKQNQPPARRG